MAAIIWSNLIDSDKEHDTDLQTSVCVFCYGSLRLCYYLGLVG